MTIRLYKALFSCLTLLFYVSHSQASTPDDSIAKYLVTFAPAILEGRNHYPCQGVRLNSDVLLTNHNCVRLIAEKLASGISLEALDSQRLPIGRVRLLAGTESNKGFLGLDHGKALVKSEERYPGLQQTRPDRLKPAKAFYQPFQGGKTRVVPLILIYHKSDSYHHYIINTTEALPAGTPIVADGQVVCSVDSEQSCKAPVPDKKQLERVKRDCQGFSPDLAYSGCMNTTITACSGNLWETKTSGTCINSKSGETCTFSSDRQHTAGRDISVESVTCPSCSASLYNNAPAISNVCEPVSCIEGCESGVQGTQQQGESGAAQQTTARVKESCSQCLAEEQQMFNNCQQVCQGGFSYQACESCSEAVDQQEAYCKDICDSEPFAVGF